MLEIPIMSQILTFDILSLRDLVHPVSKSPVLFDSVFSCFVLLYPHVTMLFLARCCKMMFVDLYANPRVCKCNGKHCHSFNSINHAIRWYVNITTYTCTSLLRSYKTLLSQFMMIQKIEIFARDCYRFCLIYVYWFCLLIIIFVVTGIIFIFVVEWYYSSLLYAERTVCVDLSVTHQVVSCQRCLLCSAHGSA